VLNLHALPRESRDTLFLLAVVGWVVLMQVGHIPAWCTALAVALLGWRTVLTLRGGSLPGRAWRIGLLALTLVATAFTYRTVLGRDAGVTLIVVLLCLKTLEMRARRDAFVVFFLAFFTLLTHFFYSQSLLTAAGILVALLGLLSALVNAHMPVGRPPLREAVRTAATMAALGAPIMLALFMLFPRTGPLWGLPDDGLSGRSGLSGQMRVGQIARLALDSRIAFRVRFDSAVPPNEALYFRGPVLSDFDGIEWRPLRSGFPAGMALPANLGVSGPPVRYEVTMEPHNRPWLFLLEATPVAPVVPDHETFMAADLQWLTQRPVASLVRYQAESHRAFRHGPMQSTVALQDHLSLPPGFNPRTLTLAQTLRRQYGAGPEHAPALVKAVLERLRTGGYRYTLTPDPFGTHTADEFWFDRREGFCEHIASSFVILMRGLDIPARIVTGYQGGERNPVDGDWTVRQQDAHAWAEVWLQGQGWVRFDPTSAVAPARTDDLQRLSSPPGMVGNAWRTLDPDTAARLRALWDAANNRWNQWVLNYSQARQMDLLRRLGFASPGWAELATVLIGVVAAVTLGVASWWLWKRQPHDPWLRMLTQARRRLQKAGLPSAQHVPPRTLATQVQQHFGDTAFSQALHDWLLRLEAQRYAPDSPLSLVTLQREFKQLVWQREDKP
jgi:protein-glutamine gamma-glutamyltransferase